MGKKHASQYANFGSLQHEFPERLFLLDNFVSKFVFRKKYQERKE